MFLMSNSIVLCQNLIFTNQEVLRRNSSIFSAQLGGKRRWVSGIVPNAKNNSRHTKKRTWWQKFFFDEDGNWFGLKDDDMVENQLEVSSDEELSQGDKFEEWKRRAEAIVELREAQEDMMNEESRRWEDWFVDGNNHVSDSSWSQDWDSGVGNSREDVQADPSEMIPEKGFIESVRDLVIGEEDDDMLYEDRVFRFASLNSVSLYMQLVLLDTYDCLIYIICLSAVLIPVNLHCMGCLWVSSAIQVNPSLLIIITYQM